MSSIVVVDRSGLEHTLTAGNGRTLMEVIRDEGLDDMLALCGGCLSCATCHVHVAPPFLEILAPNSEDENDLLATLAHRESGSRLACQLMLDDSHDGLRVRIAPEE